MADYPPVVVIGLTDSYRPREDLNHCPIKERYMYKKGICQN
jgi:hypothetical protein